MLVLSRKLHEKVEIYVPASDQLQVINVYLCEIISDKRARIGLEANNRNILFIREELIARKADAGPDKTMETDG